MPQTPYDFVSLAEFKYLTIFKTILTSVFFFGKDLPAQTLNG